MRSTFYIIISIILGLLFSIPSSGKELSSLPADGAVTIGVLPDGLTYCIVTSKVEKGRSEWILLQRACQTGSEYSSTMDANVTKTPSYRLWDFGKSNVSRGSQVQDSLAFKMIGTIKNSIEEDSAKYGTDNQIIIVCGDVDKAALIEKLRIFTYMVPKSDSDNSWKYDYEWKETDFSATVLPSEIEDVTNVTITCLSPRPKAERLTTILPAVSDRMSETVSGIALHRLENTFYDLDIPVAGLDVSHVPADMTEGDLEINISFSVADDDLYPALKAAKNTLSAISSGNVAETEILQVSEASIENFRLKSTETVSNREWVRRCISHFITGTDLAPATEKVKLLTERVIPDSTKVKSFNMLAKATFGSTENMRVVCQGGKLTEELITKIFTQTQEKDSTKVSRGSFVSIKSANLQEPAKKKVKPKKTLPEKTLGATEYRFASGLKVIYKQMATGGYLHYSLVLGGGRSSLKGAVAGESAYLSDIFEVCGINGHPFGGYKRLMEANGVKIDCNTKFDDTIISGTAKSDQPELLFRFLLPILNSRSESEMMYDYYLKCEDIEARLNGTEAILDRMEDALAPGYAFSDKRTRGILADDFYERASQFYETIFSRTNDGALIVVGDITPYRFLTALQQFAGAFRTKTTTHRRPTVQYRLLSGERTMSSDIEYKMFRMAAAGDYDVSLENRLAAAAAGDMLQNALSKALGGSGYSVEASITLEADPKGHLSAKVYAQGVPMPKKARELMSNDVKAIVLRTLKDLSEGRFPAGEPAQSKADVSNDIATASSGAAYWLEIGEEKICGAKDYNTGYAAKVNVLSNDKIKDVFSTLYNGGRIVIY